MEDPLSTGVPVATVAVGPPLTEPFERAGSWGGSATRVDPEVVHGWNGLAAADRVEFSHKAENLFWSSQQARLQFFLSSLLHAVTISLASVTFMHHTFQVVGHPIQVGMEVIA